MCETALPPVREHIMYGNAQANPALLPEVSPKRLRHRAFRTPFRTNPGGDLSLASACVLVMPRREV